MKTTFRSAAQQVLQRACVPMTAEEITIRAFEDGILYSHGATPEATMSAQIYSDLQKNPKTKFVKLKPNLFGLSDWDYKLAFTALRVISQAAQKEI